MKAKIIAWENFVPQYEKDSLDGIDKNEIIVNTDNQDGNDYQDENEEHQIEEILGFQINQISLPRKVSTPFGVFEADDPFSPYNMFECWIGHANFKISERDLEKLDTEIDGIGCLKILSPYRFFIGIEKMFSFSEVRSQIQEVVCEQVSNPKIEDSATIDELIDSAIDLLNESVLSQGANSNKWAMFIGNDGTIESINSEDFPSEAEYTEKLGEMKKIKKGNICRIITSDFL